MELNWYLKKIPKLCHFYWGGGPMVYLRYLSIKTFIKHNPDWKVIFWYPQEPFKGRSWYSDMYPPKINETICRDYFDDVLKLDVVKSPVDFRALGARSNMAEVHKNDYIRVHALYLYGGLWSDTDIIYFRSMDALKSNISGNKDKEAFVCISDYGHSTGFNMAAGNSEFIGILIDNLNREYKSNAYQCWGPDIFNKYFKTLKSIPHGADIGMDAVYAHDIHNVNDLLSDVTHRFTEHSIGCHWYGGHQQWPEFFNRTAGGEINLPKCLISDLIEQV